MKTIRIKLTQPFNNQEEFEKIQLPRLGVERKYK